MLLADRNARRWTVRVCPHGMRVELKGNSYWAHMDRPPGTTLDCNASSTEHAVLTVVSLSDVVDWLREEYANVAGLDPATEVEREFGGKG